MASIVGTGMGSDAVILFNPGNYVDWDGPAPPYPFGLSDRALVHELVHAMSDVSGMNACAMTGPNGYDNLEEFTAIVVTNVLISEEGGDWGSLLADHHGGLLPLALIDSQAFYNKYSAYMQQACANHPLLAKELKKATGIKHNPFVYCTGV